LPRQSAPAATYYSSALRVARASRNMITAPASSASSPGAMQTAAAVVMRRILASLALTGNRASGPRRAMPTALGPTASHFQHVTCGHRMRLPEPPTFRRARRPQTLLARGRSVLVGVQSPTPQRPGTLPRPAGQLPRRAQAQDDAAGRSGRVAAGRGRPSDRRPRKSGRATQARSAPGPPPEQACAGHAHGRRMASPAAPGHPDRAEAGGGTQPAFGCGQTHRAELERLAKAEWHRPDGTARRPRSQQVPAVTTERCFLLWALSGVPGTS